MGIESAPRRVESCGVFKRALVCALNWSAGPEDALPSSCPELDLINELAVQRLTLGNRATCHRDGRGRLDSTHPDSSLVGFVGDGSAAEVPLSQWEALREHHGESGS